MKLLFIVSVATIGFGLARPALADRLDGLVSEGYRWVSAEGPYACPAKDDVTEILKHYSEDKEFKMVEELRVYYLVPGTIVQVVQSDAASGMSQIRIDGITRDLWTLRTFLSTRPVLDPCGVVETPRRSKESLVSQ